MSRHIVQGRIVAKARYFLERLDKAEEPIEILAEVNGAILTGDMLRTLLAEHDAYREEVRVVNDDAGPEALSLSVTQLRDEVKAAWLDVRNEPARRDVAGYLAVAYDQLERACKAAGITTKAEDSNG